MQLTLFAWRIKMANSDIRKGLLPIRGRNGQPYNGAANPYYVPASYATALFKGDAVVKTGTSNTSAFEEWQPGTLPEVNKVVGGSGNPITGVIVAVGVNRDDLTKIYSPASTEAVVWVCDDLDAVYELQDDGGAALDATSVGLNAVLIDTHAGDEFTGLSGTELDAGTTTAPAVNAAYQLTIQRLINREDNALGVNAKWEVKINLSTEANAVAGI